MSQRPSHDDLHRLQQRMDRFKALYAEASVPDLQAQERHELDACTLAGLSADQQRCALLLRTFERRALAGRWPAQELTGAYAEAATPPASASAEPRIHRTTMQLREAELRALASLMTPGLRRAALEDACTPRHPGLGDPKATVPRDLLRRRLWVLFDFMRPEELVHARQRLATMKASLDALHARQPGAVTRAEADLVKLFQHALAQSDERRGSRGPVDSSEARRAGLTQWYLPRGELRASDFARACRPLDPGGPAFKDQDAAIQDRALRMQVLLALMTPPQRLAVLDAAWNEVTEAARARGGPPDDASRQLMLKRLRAFFGALGPAEIAAASNRLIALNAENAASFMREGGTSLRVQKARGQFLGLCHDALQTVLGPAHRTRTG